MNSIYFVIECSFMAHPNQRTVAKLRLKKKALNKIIFWGKSTKWATRDSALSFKLAFFQKSSKWWWNFNLSSKIMPSNSYFLEFVMVKSSSLNFSFSVPLTIKWHLSKFSLSLFSLNQLKSGIDSSSSKLFTESVFLLIV